MPALRRFPFRGLAEVRGGRAEDSEWRNDVNVQHRLKLLVGRLLNDVVPGVTGIIHEDVETAQPLDGVINQLLWKLGIGKVASEVSRSRSLSRDGSESFRQRF